MTDDLTTRAVDVLAKAMALPADDPLLRRALEALLAARTNCETCAGTGRVFSADTHQIVHSVSTGQTNQTLCPTCTGSGRGDGFLVAILMERVPGSRAAPERNLSDEITVHYREKSCDDTPPCLPVYVERPVDQP